jgi:ABC-2 type transport system permease protein
MRNVWTIARREYRLYFLTPLAYVAAFAFLVLLGVLFSIDLTNTVVQSSFQPSAPGVQIVLGPIVSLMLFILMPAVTMRSLADEQRMGTLELLLTTPIRDWELVVGKWLGGLLFVLTLLAFTLVYPIILNFIVDPGIDQGVLLTGYLGLIFFGGSLIAIGIAVSSFFNNPNSALIANYVVVLALWLIGSNPQPGASAGNEILSYLNFIDHYLSFFRGIIDLTDIIYYLSVISLSLFLGSVVVASRRWR